VGQKIVRRRCDIDDAPGSFSLLSIPTDERVTVPQGNRHVDGVTPAQAEVDRQSGWLPCEAFVNCFQDESEPNQTIKVHD
jgi:hypothetical protein